MEEPQGTITPNPDFHKEREAERMKKSMRGIGSDEKMIIRILVSHDSLQREEIENKYKALYGGDLVEDLKSELGGHFENTVVALLTSKYDLLVNALQDSFTLVGTDAQILTEILCCREAEDLNSLRWWFENSFSQSLDDAIQSNVSGDFKSLLLSLMNSERATEEPQEVDQQKAQEDAEKLYEAGIGFNADTDESVFISLFNNRSFSHLAKVFERYETYSDEPIEDSINSEFNGDIRDGLLAIAKRVKDPYGFFAERLNKSMMGAGTDDRTLIRIIVSRSEVDLVNIKQRYAEMYGNSLANDVRDDTGGDYTKLLLAIINKKQQE